MFGFFRRRAKKNYLRAPERFTKPFSARKKFSPIPNKVVVVPPTNGGSLGDEAMMVAAITELHTFSKEVVVISGDGRWASRLKEYNLSVREIEITGLYDRPNIFTKFHTVLLAEKPQSFYLIGADVMDGFYSVVRSLNRMSLLEIASYSIDDVRLLGFSFNEKPVPITITHLKNIQDKGVRIQARDPVSSNRLDGQDIQNYLVADLAFLLKPSCISHLGEIDLAEWIKEGKDNNFSIVCINLNAIHIVKWGADFFNKCIAVIEEIIHIKKSKIIFVSHDHRDFDGNTDLLVAEKLARKMGLVEREDYIYAPESTLATELKYIANQSDFVITGRMHFAIAAMGQGVPTMMFGYQGKQQGLAQHFDIDDKQIVLSPSESLDVQKEQVRMFLSSLENISNELSSALPLVKENALRNLIEYS